jgi:3-oxoadipate enol-lactonase
VDTRLSFVGPAPQLVVEWCGNGPLVLMMHGIGGNRGNWKAQLADLGRDFTAAAWDARGYGSSDDYDGPLAFEDFSRDVLRVLDAFGADRAHLVGLSMGGRIALDFAGRHGDRVASLVLADTSAGSAETASPEKVEQFLLARKKPLLEGRTPADIAPSLAPTLVGRSVTPAVLADVVASLSALHVESYLKTLDTVTRYTAFPALAGVQLPALVIVGEEDGIATPAYARSMAASLPRGEFHLLEGTGHLSNMENPLGFNRAVRAFLERHPLAAPAARPPAPGHAAGVRP